jgi:hypothetical protein
MSHKSTVDPVVLTARSPGRRGGCVLAGAAGLAMVFVAVRGGSTDGLLGVAVEVLGIIGLLAFIVALMFLPAPPLRCHRLAHGGSRHADRPRRTRFPNPR